MLKGLKGLREYQEAKEASTGRTERESVEYVKWPKPKKPGAPVTITGRFLNELDDESPSFREEAGLAHIVLEHVGPGPKGYQRRAECTVDEGECYPDEQIKAFYKSIEGSDDKDAWKKNPWRKASARAYLNFAYEDEDGNEQVGVYATPVEGQNIFQTLLQYADTGSITDKVFKITRSGEGTKTTYTAIVVPNEVPDKDVTDYTLQDLDNAHLKLPYRDQKRFYESAPGWVPTSNSSSDSGSEDRSAPKQDGPGWNSW